MKTWLRVLVFSAAAGCFAAGCAPPEDDSGGSGGAAGNSGTTGTGGTTSTGTGGTTSTGTGGTTSTGTGGTTSTGTGGTTSAGTGGISGSAGRGGSNGSAGRGGTTGAAGSAGSGSAGRGGTTGGAGRGGTTGAAGSVGTGGSTGGGGTSGTYNPCPTNGDPCKILPVGDSITFGINQEGSYRIELFRKTLMAMQKITFTGTLQNGPQMVDGVTFPRRYEATSGITIDGISTQITRNNTLAMPADIILVHIGTNDMYMGDPGGAPQRLGTLLDKLATGLPNALIVVAKIIPLPSGAAAVKTFNAAIPGIVQTRVAAGKHMIVIDENTTFPSSGLSSDNVHPNPSGYAWMAGVWYDAISGLLPK